MIGHQQIIKARRSGKRPACVFVQYGMDAKPRNDIHHPERQIQQGMLPTVYMKNGEVPDIRFLSGCKVIFTCDGITPQAREVTQKIIEIQPEMLMFSCLKTNQLGIWEKGEWRT